MKHTKEDLRIMQGWSLQRKIQVTQTRIIEWYQRFDGQVYISFSGGKDSTVLLDLARRIYPDVPAVFIDTGLEYPEIRKFVKRFDNVEWLRPEKSFKTVIEEYGYPVISKETAKVIDYARRGSQWAVNNLNGVKKDGTPSEFKRQFAKYKNLIDAPFKISSNCCDIMKKRPFRKYEKHTGRKPIIGTMAYEGRKREDGWLKTGCNAVDSDHPKSQPMAFWTEQDVLQYIKLTDLPIAECYGDIVSSDGDCDYSETLTETKLHCTGCQRTGCMFCMFGVHLEKGENRFQRMAITHPKQYDYCINKLGCGQVLDYIGVDYKPISCTQRGE